jgi:hypothetical protein
MPFMATAFGKNAPKYGTQCKSSSLKICTKFSAKMLLEQKSIFWTIYLMLAPLCIAQIGW